MNNIDFPLLHLNTVRIYLQQNQTMPAASFWRRLFPQNVATEIMKAAKRDNISQAIQYPVKAGFFHGSELVFDQTDVPPTRLPVCIELVDSAEPLKQFIQNHQMLLSHARTILENAQTYELVHLR